MTRELKRLRKECSSLKSDIIQDIEKNAQISFDNLTQIINTIMSTVDTPQDILTMRLVVIDLVDAMAKERLGEICNEP